MQVVTGTCHHACAHHPHTFIIRSPLACDLLPPFIRHPPPCRRNHSRTRTHAGCLAAAQMCSRAHACSVGHSSCSSAQRGSGSHPEKTNQHVGMRTQNAHTFTTSTIHVRSGALNQIRQTAAGILQHHHLPARFTVAAAATRSKDKGEGGSSHTAGPCRPRPPSVRHHHY